MNEGRRAAVNGSVEGWVARMVSTEWPGRLISLMDAYRRATALVDCRVRGLDRDDASNRAASARRLPPVRTERGISLIETMIAVAVMSICLIGTASVLTQGVQRTNSSPGDLMATQKAQEAIESVFSARDSKVLTWAQIRNVAGSSGSDGGIFLDGPLPLKVPGADGLVGTADDGAVESVTFPGRDALFGTSDDEVRTLDGFMREIAIRDIQPNLREITVTVTFQSGNARRTYKLTAFISNYA